MPLYFIAIVAPGEINRQVLEWKSYMLLRFGCRVALKSPAHITLIPPFHMTEKQELVLGAAMRELAQQERKLEVRLNGFSAFAPTVIFIEVEQGTRLQQLKTHSETFLRPQADLPIRKDDRPFHPHITIANRDLKKEDFPMAWEYFRGRPYEASFEAGAISLLRNRGGQWEIIAESPLHP